MAKEAAKASKQASYELGVQETEVRLVDELAEVCTDYYKEVWLKALNLAGVPIASEWREARNVYYPPDIREVPTDLPPSPALAPLSIKQPLTTEAFLPPPEVLKEPNQVGDQGQGVEKTKDKGKGKEVQAPPKAKDATKAKDAAEAKDAAKAKDTAVKAKEAEDKSKDAATAKDAPAFKPSNKEDLPPNSKAQLQDFMPSFLFCSFCFCFFFFFCSGNLPLYIMYLPFI